ncbi:MAG: exosortase B [Thermoplasmataceae archaeon]
MNSSVIPSVPVGPDSGSALKNGWPVFAGLLALYAPTYWTLITGSWGVDHDTHGLIVLAVVLFLLWQERALLRSEIAPSGMRAVDLRDAWVGWVSLVLGVLMYILGRSQNIQTFEVDSQIPVILGLLLMMQGRRIVTAVWFPLLFLLFIIPLPAFIVATATPPLKNHVSQVAERILYFFHYPVARNGVVLTIGSYQLLIANACSGLNAVFSLAALGFLYIYLIRNTSWVRNGILLASILPIAFIANTVRVVVLALITYYWGSQAIEGFLHPLAGIVLFNAAVFLMFALDLALGWILPDHQDVRATHDRPSGDHPT